MRYIEVLEHRWLLSGTPVVDDVPSSGNNSQVALALGVARADVGNQSFTFIGSKDIGLMIRLDPAYGGVVNVGKEVHVHLGPTPALGSESPYSMTSPTGEILSYGSWGYSSSDVNPSAALQLYDEKYGKIAPETQMIGLVYDDSGSGFFSSFYTTGNFSIGPLAGDPAAGRNTTSPPPAIPPTTTVPPPVGAGPSVTMSMSGNLPPTIYRGEFLKVRQRVVITNTSATPLFASSVQLVLTEEVGPDLAIMGQYKPIKLNPGQSKSVKLTARGDFNYTEKGYPLEVHLESAPGVTLLSTGVGALTIAPSRVDLSTTLDNSKFPDTLARGTSIKIKTRLSNESTIPATFSNAAVFGYLTGDASGTGEKVLLGQRTGALRFKGQQQKQVNFKGLIPTTIAPGSYFLVIHLPPNYQANETNDIAVSAIPIVIT